MRDERTPPPRSGKTSMKTSRQFPLTSLAACLVVCSAAVAEDRNPSTHLEVPCTAIEGPVEEAVRFVEDATGEGLAEICIKVVSPETIRAAFRATAGFHDQQPEIGGLFVIADETVLIPTTLDLNNAYDLSFLVHEITHYHQGKAGLLTDGARLGGVECDAYLMQASFLRSQGLPREALITSLQAELQAGSICEY